VAAGAGRPRIFLGSSGKQAKLLAALNRGLGEVAEVEPWTTVFNPGTSTLERLVELTREVDFAAFVFAQDDWTSNGAPAADGAGTGQVAGQASPRDNVVFEAGLFGGVLGMRRTFILHARGAKLPSDLLGLTAIRYDEDLTPAGMKAINQKLRDAIAAETHGARIEGLWWQFSLTARSEKEPSAVSLLKIGRGRDGALEMTGRSWRVDGVLSARYASEAVRELRDPCGLFYYWRGERPLDPDAPEMHGRGEIKLETPERAAGYFTTLSDRDPEVRVKTSGIYLRAGRDDWAVLDGPDDRARAALIAERLDRWKGIRNV
jgi:hypothetical protein